MGEIQPRYKFFFLDVITNTQTQLNHDVDGWKDYGIGYGRDQEVSNTVKTYASEWVFIGKDALYLRNILFTYGPNRQIRLIVKVLDDWKSDAYINDFVGDIDFSTYEYDSVTFSVIIREGGFISLMENKWNEKFDIQFNKTLNFTGKVFNSEGEFERDMEGNYVDAITPADSQASTFILGGKLKNLDTIDFFEDSFKSSVYPHADQPLEADGAFLQLNSGEIKGLTIDYDVNVEINVTLTTNSIYPDFFITRYQLLILEYNTSTVENGQATLSRGRRFVIDYFDLPRPLITSNPFRDTVRFQGNGFQINNINSANDKTYFFAIVANWGYGSPDPLHAWVKSGTTLSMAYDNYSFTPHLNVQVNLNRPVQIIDQETVFRQLIDNVNRGQYNVRLDIDKFLQASKGECLTSGLGLRGFELGREDEYFDLQTSIKDFLTWVYIAYNFKIDIIYDKYNDVYTVQLLHFDDCFNNRQITKLEKVNEVYISNYRDKMYTTIEVGYNTSGKAIGGLSEYNSILRFETPNRYIPENKWELISPYSGSVSAIETEIYENYRNFKDAFDKDQENFVMSYHYEIDRDRFELDKSIIDTNLPYPETQWNLPITPKRLLLHHQSEIDSIFNLDRNESLIFTTSDRYSGLIADGIIENGPVAITDRNKYRPVMITLYSEGNIDIISKIDQNRNGYFEFDYEGKIYKGYIAPVVDSVTINPMDEKASRFVILSHPDNDFT